MLALLLATAPMAGAMAQTPASDAPGRTVVRPNWRKVPTGDEMAMFFPRDAMRRRLSGRVIMQCKVAREGTLYSCVIVSETPPKAGFGDAALKLAPYFEMTPLMVDGQPVDGGDVRIPVLFQFDSAASPASRSRWTWLPSPSDVVLWLRALISAFISTLQNLL